MSKGKARPTEYPSSKALSELHRLTAEPTSADRAVRAWYEVVYATGNPDFHAVLDFALEHELVATCDVADPLAEPVPTWVNPADGSEMVWIPPGRFVVGPDAAPADCGGFSLAKHPVTNRQFAAFLEQSEYGRSVDPADESGGGRFLQHWANGKPPRGKEDHPVVFVSYLDALEYCAWMGLTLPGEFHWEKAARGPEGRPYPWGDANPTWRSSGSLAHVAAADTCAVGRFAKVRSPYGCEGLIGNVSEWCQPGNAKAPGEFPPHAPDVRPTGRGGKPVYAAVRGSAYLRTDAARMRSHHRRRLSVTRRNQWVGFRPALYLPCRPAV